ncbi:hypothetical protein RRG08_041528 [Elysia crispata]|uniref:Uncharacterized protein n=1 Tax=Elysia crispata TaxID=231223 RepID=A0AAE1AZ98_9GAST|nr:hypothetical protein RRG08_041528 [Elysia crispata]
MPRLRVCRRNACKFYPEAKSVLVKWSGFFQAACCAGGPIAALQLEEAARAQLVLVVIGSEQMNTYFQSLLGFLPSLTEHRDDYPTPPRMLVAVIEEGVSVPTPISAFPTVPRVESLAASLDAYMERCDEDEDGATDGASGDVDEDVKVYVEDIMSFFCGIISTSWPLPT